MSCICCKYYKGINKNCSKNVYISNTYESINCKHYQYNGEILQNTKEVRTEFKW